MRKLFLTLAAILMCVAANAATSYTVTVVYNGSTATVSIPGEVSGYVTCQSGTSAHVKLVQLSTSDNNPGEIIYKLSGSSEDGEFYFTGDYKATLQLDGLTLTNPDSTAIHIKDGKRIKISMVNETVSTLTDGAMDAESKGCLHVKGHTEFVGKGTLNIVSNIRHAIFSKEYIELKNCTINVKGAKKDGIHCQQYFRMTSGVVNISDVEDDGIRVELKGETPTQGSDTEDEDTGNFYMTGGTLTIDNVGAKCIKTAGTITYSGGEQNFDKTNTEQNAVSAIHAVPVQTKDTEAIYDLSGRRVTDSQLSKGVYIIRRGGKTQKVLIK
ncbi:MAG: carbohydrate-binding domain-containing protein [Prevotella sp.]|nr:carbohydrate-binding domain-containing protein [Prevotella sp.]